MIPEFANKIDRLRWLGANKDMLIATKKANVKYADAFNCGVITTGTSGLIEKAPANIELIKLDEFPVKVVINTTNIRDSHKDVHLPGIWEKNLSETKKSYHVQEHNFTFKGIISDRVNAFTKNVLWSEFGFKFAGKTQALIFDSIIEKARNDAAAFMAEQYAKGYVDAHSVGMQYVKVFLALFSDYKGDVKERETWEKYISEIVNRDEVEDEGYFFAVTEAKVIEGSAVPRGSNYATPTIQIGKSNAPEEAVADTPAAPLFGLKFLTN